jgi:hypothetical protein
VRLDLNSLAAARSLAAALASPPTPRLEAALGRHAEAAAARGPHARITAALALLSAVLDGERVGAHAVALRAAALRGDTAAERVRIAERLSEAAVAAAGRSEPPRAELDRLSAETEATARAALVAALLDGGAHGDLGEQLDGVLLGARPRPRAVPDGLPGLAMRAA